MQRQIEEFGIQFDVASRACIGQEPITLEGSTSQPINTCKITQNYGRFGNNFFQVANALAIAAALRCGRVVLPPTMPRATHILRTCRGARIFDNTDKLLPGSALLGSFYAPFGFEKIFTQTSITEKVAIVDYVDEVLYSHLRVFDGENSLVLHFRGGDIFRKETVHPWYTQPPAAFYINSLEHALRQSIYSSIFLVAEDDLNPCVEVLANYLSRSGISFFRTFGNVNSDIKLLRSAKTIIASSSTFCEVAALISKTLSSYYAFRRASSQYAMTPFLQSHIAQILMARKVQCWMVDDISYSYIGDKDWRAAPDQIAAMVSFPGEWLRIYEI